MAVVVVMTRGVFMRMFLMIMMMVVTVVVMLMFHSTSIP